MSKALKVKVEGLSTAHKIPGWLERGQRETLERAGDAIAEDLRKAAPGGNSGGVARSVHTNTLSSTRLEVNVTHPGAKALARGAFIKSKRGPGTAIRFANGRFVRFPHGVRLPTTNWDKKGLRKRATRIREAYQEVFDDLERLG